MPKTATEADMIAIRIENVDANAMANSTVELHCLLKFSAVGFTGFKMLQSGSVLKLTVLGESISCVWLLFQSSHTSCSLK